MLLFWCSWFKYRLIKLDLVTAGKFCFNFSRVLDGVVDCVSVKPRGGVLPEKLGRGVRPASQNPYPIYDQNL